MAKAIRAVCGASTFAEPRAAPLGRSVPPLGWQVIYLYPPRSGIRPRPGQTTAVTLVEVPPRPGPPPHLVGGKEISVAGQRVSFRNRTANTVYVATWQTGKARYTALANGSSPATVEGIIRCLP